jgi:hypothetical protein
MLSHKIKYDLQPAWRALLEAYGGVPGFAQAAGVDLETVRLWRKSDIVKPRVRTLVDALSAAKGVHSPFGPGALLPPGPVASPPASASSAPTAAPAVASHTSPRENAEETLRMLRQRLAECDPDDVPKVSNAIAVSSRLLATLTGQTDITPAKLLKSNAMRVVVAEMMRALGPYPEAAKALLEAMKRFDEFGGGYGQ